jgi:hypothetical protein
VILQNKRISVLDRTAPIEVLDEIVIDELESGYQPRHDAAQGWQPVTEHHVWPAMA